MAYATRMKQVVTFLLYLAVFLLPFGQLLQYPVAPSVQVYAIDAVIFLLAIVWTVHRLVEKKPPTTPPLAPFVVLFTGIGIISLLFSLFRFNLTEVGIGSLYLLRWISYASLYFVAYEYNDKQKLLKALMAAGVVSALFGLFQYFLYPNLRNLMYLGWDPHEYRIFGTFFDSGFAGIIYVLTLILIVYFYLQNNINKTLLISAGLITYLALALTYARSSYLAFLTAFFILSILKQTYKFALISIMLIGITVFVLPRPSETSEGVKLERTASVSARGDNYLHTLSIIEDNPVVGVGFNTLRYENSKRGYVAPIDEDISHAAAGSDSSLLFVAATTGIIGLILYIFVVVPDGRD